MSTKQIVIFTFMVIFLAAMLFALGAWFHLSMELDIRKKALEQLTEKELNLQKVVEGDINVDGSKKKNDDPVDGLKQRVEKERQRVTAIIGAVDTGGEEMRKALYEGEAKNIEAKWPEAAENRKKLYETWKTQSAAVQAAIVRFATAVSDRDKNVA